TKMRSVIDAANPAGIAANIAQQFEIGAQITAKGLMPILEPEVTITIADKAEAEDIVLEEITKHLDALPDGEEIMLKLSLPTKVNHYKPLVDHPKVLKVVALSGGYSRDEANGLLSQQTGMIASFSRALSEGLSDSQPDAAFDATLAATVDSIYQASIAG
ncbi:MAG: class I fructose-bisphosphate aldolase, partial [Pseudomonadota bacterium]